MSCKMEGHELRSGLQWGRGMQAWGRGKVGEMSAMTPLTASSTHMGKGHF